MLVKTLRLMTALCAFITSLAALGALIDYLPVNHAVIAGAALAFILGIKEAVIQAGDVLDDGEKNGSFPGGLNIITKNTPPLSAISVGAILGILFASLTGCVSSSSTDRELSAAQMSLGAAEIAFVIAESQVQAALIDSKMPAWKRVALAASSKQARLALEREQARVALLVAKRATAEVPAVPLPAVSAKPAPMLPLGF